MQSGRFFTTGLNSIKRLKGRYQRVRIDIQLLQRSMKITSGTRRLSVDNSVLPHFDQCFTRARDRFSRLLEIVKGRFGFRRKLITAISASS